MSANTATDSDLPWETETIRSIVRERDLLRKAVIDAALSIANYHEITGMGSGDEETIDFAILAGYDSRKEGRSFKRAKRWLLKQVARG